MYWVLIFRRTASTFAIAGNEILVIRRLRDGFSRVFKQSDHQFPWSVRFSQDGRYVASGGNRQGNRIRILNVRIGKCVARQGAHDGVVEDLVFTPDGKGLLSASWDDMVIHWDVSWLESTHGNTDIQKEVIPTPDSTGGLIEMSRFVGHENDIHAVSISPDGNWIASGSRDNTVRIWNAHSTALQCILHGCEAVWSVDFSRVGNYLAVGGEKGQVTIWNYANL